MEKKAPSITLIVVLVLTGAAIWALDGFLARTEKTELSAEAQQDYEDGTRLLAAGDASGAVDLLRKANSLERSNQKYALQLAAALMKDDKLDEAQTLLGDVLERAPNDGEANLLEARLMVQRGQFEDAQAYYHRAIYGTWSDPKQRVKVRMELVNLLASRGKDQELLAELLSLEPDAGKDRALREQIAHGYLTAHSPARAEALFKSLIDEDPESGSDYVGLGDADLALANYRGAEFAFQTAIRRGADAKSRLDLAAEMAELDPTIRRLSSMEKFARSVRILQLAREALARCPNPDQQLLTDADSALKTKIRANVTNELAESRLAMAERLWQARLSACGPSTSAEEEPLRLVMAKLAQ